MANEDDEIEKLEIRKNQLNARIQEKKRKRIARTKAEKRKRDTRFKIIFGALTFSLINSKPSFGVGLVKSFAKIETLTKSDAEFLIENLSLELSTAFATALEEEGKFNE